MTWTIDIPHDPDDLGQPLSEAIAANLDDAIEDPESRRVAAQLFLIADRDGLRTTGGLLDHVEALDSDGRRELLDRARQAAGLTPSAEIEAAKNHEALQPRGPRRDEQGRSFQICAAAGCRAYPLDSAGLPSATAARRWWCAQHQHLAEDGDLEPPQSAYSIAADMSLRPSAAEAERLAAEQAAERKRAERVRAAREAERDRIAARRDEIPHLRFGRTLRFRSAAIEEWLRVTERGTLNGSK